MITKNMLKYHDFKSSKIACRRVFLNFLKNTPTFLKYCVKNDTFFRDSFAYNQKMDIFKMSKKFNFENLFYFFLHFLHIQFNVFANYLLDFSNVFFTVNTHSLTYNFEVLFHFNRVVLISGVRICPFN